MPANRRSDLAEHRTAKGITLSDIEFSTRIGLHFLEAIEAEDFNSLPGGVYAISYLRQYARASGFDESALLRRYYEKTGLKAPGSPEPPSRPISGIWEPLRALLEHLPRRQHSGKHA